MRRLHSTAVPGKEVKIGGNATVPFVTLLNAKIFTLATAITSGVTVDSVGAVAGDFATTTHATGRGKLFASDGTNWVAVGDGAVTPAAHVASVTTANATDLASAIALANAEKTTINAILTALQNAGLMS